MDSENIIYYVTDKNDEDGNNIYTAYSSKILALLNSEEKLTSLEIKELKPAFYNNIDEYKKVVYEIILTVQEKEKFKYMNIYEKKYFLYEKIIKIKDTNLN